MRNHLFAALLGFGALLALPLGAHAGQPYNAAAFQEAQKAGKTILLHITAPWCSTCKAQLPTLASIQKENPALVAYDIDFDSAKEVLRQFRVQAQSTVIVFKGEKEIGRSTGVTNPDRLRDLVAKGL